MTAVECSLNSVAYRCQVNAGALASATLTGKNNSVGLRTTCTIPFTAAQTDTNKTVATMIRTGNGALRKVTIARPASRRAVERRARRRRWRVAGGSERGIGADGMTESSSSMPGLRSSRRLRGAPVVFLQVPFREDAFAVQEGMALVRIAILFMISSPAIAKAETHEIFDRDAQTQIVNAAKTGVGVYKPPTA